MSATVSDSDYQKGLLGILDLKNIKETWYTAMEKVWGFVILFLTPGKNTYFSES